MRLNVLNGSSIVALASSTGLCKLSNTRFGVTTQVNDKYFKYVFSGERKEVVLIERIDLNDLFAAPQDISELTYTPGSTLGAVDVAAGLGIDTAQEESPLVEGELLEVREGDELGKLYSLWQAFVGLSSLPRHEVELSTSEDTLLIDARNSVMYRGVLAVKFKKESVDE